MFTFTKLAATALMVVAILVTTLLVLLPSEAPASNGATVINDFGCLIIPADWGGPFALVTSDTHAVITPSGNTLLSCNFDIPDGLEPAEAVVNTDFACGTLVGLTFKSKAVASPGGNVTLTCQINGGS